MKILVTGAAGFIGFHLSNLLLDQGREVVGLDNLNHYYDVTLKKARLNLLKEKPGFSFTRLDMSDRGAMAGLMADANFDAVVNLAAQAGVRHSLKNPHDYVDTNLVGFVNLLEGCRHSGVKHLVFASSSSVYGANRAMPFSVHHGVDHPVSLYAATKKANEVMAHSYAHLYGLPCTGLRFFTVYGPWGRPDMAMFLFTRAILAGEPIKVFNNGDMKRDFTYIDDIVKGVASIIPNPPETDPNWSALAPDPASAAAPYRLYNIGNDKPVQLMRMIQILEECLGKKAEKEMLPMQPGDVQASWANVDDLARDFDYRPDTPLEEGIARFVAWYKDFYQV